MTFSGAHDGVFSLGTPASFPDSHLTVLANDIRLEINAVSNSVKINS